MPARIPPSSDFPAYCDFSCEHAAFSDPAASGACRREIAVWCTVKSAYNNKHARCFFTRADIRRVAGQPGKKTG